MNVDKIWYKAARVTIKKLFNKGQVRAIARALVLFVSFIKIQISQDIQSMAHTQNVFAIW